MTTSWDREWALFTIAKELGYMGETPSVAGTYHLCKALNAMKDWLSDREPPAGQLWRKEWWEYLYTENGFFKDDYQEAQP